MTFHKSSFNVALLLTILSKKNICYAKIHFKIKYKYSLITVK